MNHKKHRGAHKKHKKQTLLFCGVIGILFLLCMGILWKEHSRNKALTISAKREALSEREAYTYNDHLSNYLFLGIDTREPIETYEIQADSGQADTIFLVSLNRMTKEIQVLAIPRDTITEIEVLAPAGKSLGTAQQHLNIQYAFGDGKHKSCDLMKQAVSRLLHGVPIQGYCSLNLDGIPLLADLADGVEVTIPDDSFEKAYPEFQEGTTVTLTSDNVEAFIRYRDRTTSQSALVRQEHQRIFLKAYLKRARELQEKEDDFITEMYETLKPYMVTNMGTDLFMDLLEASGGKTPVEYTLPGNGSEGEDGYEEYHVDEEALSELLLQMFYQKDS